MKYTLKNSTQTVEAMLMEMAILPMSNAFCVGLLGAMLMKMAVLHRENAFCVGLLVAIHKKMNYKSKHFCVARAAFIIS